MYGKYREFRSFRIAKGTSRVNKNNTCGVYLYKVRRYGVISLIIAIAIRWISNQYSYRLLHHDKAEK